MVEQEKKVIWSTSYPGAQCVAENHHKNSGNCHTNGSYKIQTDSEPPSNVNEKDVSPVVCIHHSHKLVARSFLGSKCTYGCYTLPYIQSARGHQAWHFLSLEKRLNAPTWDSWSLMIPSCSEMKAFFSTSLCSRRSHDWNYLSPQEAQMKCHEWVSSTLHEVIKLQHGHICNFSPSYCSAKCSWKQWDVRCWWTHIKK